MKKKKKKKKKKTPDSPKIESGLVQMIMMGKSIWQMWVKVCRGLDTKPNLL